MAVLIGDSYLYYIFMVHMHRDTKTTWRKTMTMRKKTRRMPMRSMVLLQRRRYLRRRNNLPSREVCTGTTYEYSPASHTDRCSPSLPYHLSTASVRHSPSDSDSDYGSRSKKKKKARVSSDEVRVSSRGVKIPNYVDDVQDFEQFDDDEAQVANYAVAAPLKEEDEIEAVLGHCRDEQHEDDPDDNWYTNIVCLVLLSPCDRVGGGTDRLTTLVSYLPHSASTSSGRTSRICTIRTRCTNF